MSFLVLGWTASATNQVHLLDNDLKQIRPTLAQWIHSFSQWA